MNRTLTFLAAVAVVAAGSAAASADPLASGPHWIVQPTPNPSTPHDVLGSVSCTSGTFCMAVGTSGPMVTASLAHGTGVSVAVNARRSAARTVPFKPLAERWGGARWRIVPAPNPAGSTGTFLYSVACSSRRACIAVGGASAGKVGVPLAERWNGSRWSIAKTPRPPKSSFSDLDGVSCASSHECMAVGFDVSTSGVEYGLAEHWNGSRWSLAGLVQPGPDVVLYSVSCAAASSCTAVGLYEVKKTRLPLVERWTSGRWRKQPAPATGVLNGVSCPTFSRCTAVGFQPKKGQPLQSEFLAMRWNGRKWSTQSVPEPPGPPAEGSLQGVSCPTATSCEAVGPEDLAGFGAIAEHWNGTNWTLELTPVLTGTLGPSLLGVWCGAHVACRAAGSVALTTGAVQTLVEQR